MLAVRMRFGYTTTTTTTCTTTVLLLQLQQQLLLQLPPPILLLLLLLTTNLLLFLIFIVQFFRTYSSFDQVPKVNFWEQLEQQCLQMPSQQQCQTRKLCYRKDDRAMRPIHGCPENFQDSLTTPMATIPNIFHGLLFRSTL